MVATATRPAICRRAESPCMKLYADWSRRPASSRTCTVPMPTFSGRDVPREVTKRLRNAGFDAEPHGDGVLAAKK